MKCIRILTFITSALISFNLSAQKADPFKPDFSSPADIKGMSLVWNDEFNTDGKPDPASWRYETGFVRNQELQWYQEENAKCTDGILLIEGRRQKVILRLII